MDSRFVRRIVFCFPLVFAIVAFCGPDRVNCLAGEWHDAVGLPAIYTMDRDGANVRLLAKLPQMKWHGSPAWSHDGTMVAFDATPVKAGWAECRIFVIGVTGPLKGMVKDLGCGNVPTWSPDDKHIAYMVNGGNPQGVEPGIWIMNSDGGNRQRFDIDKVAGHVLSVEIRSGHLSVDTTKSQRFIHRGYCGMGIRPRWSPNGKKLVMSELSILDIESKKVSSVLPNGYRNVDGATWSPNSQRLAFIGTSGDGPELCIIDAAGTKGSLRVLLRADVKGIPSWSPDGRQIAFALSEPNGLRRLYTIPADLPGLPIPLGRINQGAWNADPEWSPDGSTIVFSSDRTGPAPPPNHFAPTPSVDDVLEWKLEIKGEKVEVVPP